MKHYHSPENVYIITCPTQLIFLKQNELEKRILDWLYYNSKIANNLIKVGMNIDIRPVQFENLSDLLRFKKNKR